MKYDSSASGVLVAFAVFAAVARWNFGLPVSDEDFEEELNSAATSMGKDPAELLEKTREQDREQDIRDDLLRNKASKLLAEKSIPVPKKAGEPKATVEAEPGEADAGDEKAGAEAGAEAEKETEAASETK